MHKFRDLGFFSRTGVAMEEGQERDSSSDEERVLIEDEDMEDSPTDNPELLLVYYETMK